jgi:hypothetical protein
MFPIFKNKDVGLSNVFLLREKSGGDYFKSLIP